MATFLLFTATVHADNEGAVRLPGFSHWGQPRPYGDMPVRTVYFFARNRTEAARHLGWYAGIAGPCDLSHGRRCKAIEGDWLRRAFAKL